MTIDEFKSHYESIIGQKIPTTGNCRCPAHDDRSVSLSVKEGDDGRILLYCHAGCETKDICAALGLKLSDLMPGNKFNGRSAPPRGPGSNNVHPDMQAAARAGEPGVLTRRAWGNRDGMSSATSVTSCWKRV